MYFNVEDAGISSRDVVLKLTTRNSRKGVGNNGKFKSLLWLGFEVGTLRICQCQRYSNSVR